MIKQYKLRFYNFRLVIFLLAISTFGIILVGSAREDLRSKQLAGVIIGLIIMIILSLMDYSWISNFQWIMYGINIVLLLICKDDVVHRDLAEQLKEHSIKRRYRAVVQGNLKEDEGTVNAPVGRHPTDRKKMAINHKNGKEAITHYKVLERFGQATYIECRLETGRTHQIRVHMASLGHPLLGDTVYGSSKNPYHLQGQALHAMILGFVHPITGEYLEFEAPLPEYFSKLLEKLRK